VQEINNKEKDEAKEGAAMSASDPTLIKEKGVWVDAFEYDDQFKLPYGIGYDAIIRRELIWLINRSSGTIRSWTNWLINSATWTTEMPWLAISTFWKSNVMVIIINKPVREF
jgi:hypothetical protein